MQSPQIKLKEIIWEITDHCNNGCKYCGSKKILNTTPINETDILTIAKSIAEYPPEEINISGGDPFCVAYPIHEEVIKIFKNAGIICKLIMSPKTLASKPANILGRTMELYDWCGISINNTYELEQANSLIADTRYKKFTVISNFSTVNIWDYHTIEAFVQKHNVAWQVQYTMGDIDTSVYDKPQARQFLFNSIRESMNKKINIVPADNMNDGPCTAGTKSLGILASGDVVPCLSMRSWADDLEEQSNLKIEPLQRIWENGFHNQRFCEFKSCKDECKAIFTKELAVTFPPICDIKKEDSDLVMKYGAFMPKPIQPINPHGGSMVYGVDPGITVVYGVFNNPSLHPSGLEKY